MIVTSSRVPNYDRLITRSEADKEGIKPVGMGATTSDVSGVSAQANTRYAANIVAIAVRSQSRVGLPFDPKERRVNTLHLTGSGKTMVAKLETILEELTRSVLAGISKEDGEAAVRVLRHLDAVSRAAATGSD